MNLALPFGGIGMDVGRGVKPPLLFLPRSRRNPVFDEPQGCAGLPIGNGTVLSISFTGLIPCPPPGADISSFIGINKTIYITGFNTPSGGAWSGYDHNGDPSDPVVYSTVTKNIEGGGTFTQPVLFLVNCNADPAYGAFGITVVAYCTGQSGVLDGNVFGFATDTVLTGPNQLVCSDVIDQNAILFNGGHFSIP